MVGIQNKFQHTHDSEPDKQNADKKRHELKERIRKEPKAKRGRLIAEIRGIAHDGTFAAMGTDNAIGILAHREKKKIFGNINTAKILVMNLPRALIERNGQSILIYDSRLHRLPDERVVMMKILIQQAN